jgi:hypothetical protein
LRFVVEHLRLSDDAGKPVTLRQRETTHKTVEGDTVERAVAEYLSRDGFEMVGEATSFIGPHVALTVRKGRAVFAIHVYPFEQGDDSDPG